MNKKIISTLILICLGLMAPGQNNSPQMADTMRSDGKIYVVIAVIATIFAALVLFLIALDRRLRKLEKQVKEKHN